jgi:hypothetical protein
MSPRASRIYLDEDVAVLLGRLLVARGFDCVSASSAGHLAWHDERHLSFAASEGRILITHNRLDFENLAKLWWGQSRNHAGIILAVRRASTYDLLRRVLPVLALYDQTEWRNVVIYA